MHRLLRLALATTAAAALGGGALVAAASPSSAAVTGGGIDFNGDGYTDVAVATASASVTGHPEGGQVVALYGSAQGLSSDRHSTFGQNTPGVPGTVETGDDFGYATAAGDFDGDGYTDLAVGAPYEDVADGTVAVLWGSAQGLTGGTTVPDPAGDSRDEWGRTLAAGDFDGDGRDDLAVGGTRSVVHVLTHGISRSGAGGTVTAVDTSGVDDAPHYPQSLTAGDVDGDGRDDLAVGGFEPGWTSKSFYLPGTPQGPSTDGAQRLPSGTIGAIGDVDGDGHGDIAIGVWDLQNGMPGAVKGGKVLVVHGTASGPGGRIESITQESGAIPGTSEYADEFGSALSLGDINGDGYQDLAIGNRYESLAGITVVGSVTVLRGSPSGLDTRHGVQSLNQDTTGVHGVNEHGDAFGSGVHLADTDGDGRADLTVDASGENGGAGALTTLRSDGHRVTAAASAGILSTGVGISHSSPARWGVFTD
jgi:FG-GAP repeat